MIVTVTLNPSLDEWVILPTLKVGALNRATEFRRYPGGKGINVSRVVKELGASGLAIAIAGGEDGHILSRHLTRDGLAHRFITVRGGTRNNYQIASRSPRGLTQINAPGPHVSSAALRQVTQAVRRALPRATCVVLSGSLPPGAPADAYAALLRACRRVGLWTALDSSGAALREGLRAAPWFIKPNREEAQELLGERLARRREIVRAAKALTRRGATVVVVSLGAEGAVLAARGESRVWRAVSPKVRVGSAVGAGDSLVAGFLIGWLRHRSLPEALRLGIACGAAAAITSGTELCRRADVRRLLPRVRIEDIA